MTQPINLSNHYHNIILVKISHGRESRQYPSTQFVETAGAILLRLSKKQVCLIHYLAKSEWLLPKGRRNCGESRHQAALREAREEMGYQCQLHHVSMPTRAAPIEETADARDIPRFLPNITEPLWSLFEN